MEYQGNLSYDELFHALKPERRRLSLIFLWELGDSAGKNSLASLVAAVEYETLDPLLVSGKARKRVVVSLHQGHIPKLRELGLVRENPDKEVALTPEAEYVVPYFPDSEVEKVREVIEKADL